MTALRATYLPYPGRVGKSAGVAELLGHLGRLLRALVVYHALKFS